jgi:hypothetical protein
LRDTFALRDQKPSVYDELEPPGVEETTNALVETNLGRRGIVKKFILGFLLASGVLNPTPAELGLLTHGTLNHPLWNQSVPVALPPIAVSAPVQPTSLEGAFVQKGWANVMVDAPYYDSMKGDKTSMNDTAVKADAGSAITHAAFGSLADMTADDDTRLAFEHLRFGGERPDIFLFGARVEVGMTVTVANAGLIRKGCTETRLNGRCPVCKKTRLKCRIARQNHRSRLQGQLSEGG